MAAVTASCTALSTPGDVLALVAAVGALSTCSTCAASAGLAATNEFTWSCCTLATIVPMIASPTEPPTWRSVWITPEASPRSLGGAVLSASVLVGLMTIPMPTPITRYPGTSQP